MVRRYVSRPRRAVASALYSADFSACRGDFAVSAALRLGPLPFGFYRVASPQLWPRVSYQHFVVIAAAHSCSGHIWFRHWTEEWACFGMSYAIAQKFFILSFLHFFTGAKFIAFYPSRVSFSIFYSPSPSSPVYVASHINICSYEFVESKTTFKFWDV